MAEHLVPSGGFWGPNGDTVINVVTCIGPHSTESAAWGQGGPVGRDVADLHGRLSHKRRVDWLAVARDNIPAVGLGGHEGLELTEASEVNRASELLGLTSGEILHQQQGRKRDTRRWRKNLKRKAWNRMIEKEIRWEDFQQLFTLGGSILGGATY